MHVLSAEVTARSASPMRQSRAAAGTWAHAPLQAATNATTSPSRRTRVVRGSCSTAVVRGSFETTGPAACWFRADRPIVAGAPVSPAMRAVIAGDFCNGASTPLPFKDWTFLNADLTISLARDPVGEWVLLDSETWLGPDGSGIAFARLGDTEGYFGRAIQSLVLDRR